MNNFKFENSTKVLFGKNCIKEYLSSILRSYGKNIILIYEEDSLLVVEKIMPILEATDKKIFKFLISSKLIEFEKVLECVQSIYGESYDLILGIGCNSTIQFCKSVSLMNCKREKFWQRYMENQGVIDFDPLPVGIIATSINSSSVMNGHIEMVNKKEKYIGSREYHKCSPAFALLDPENITSHRENRIIQEGFMIFSNLLESYFSDKACSNISDNILETLIKSVLNELKKLSLNFEDYTARSNLMWASTLSENKIIKYGRRLECGIRQIAHQVSENIGCSYEEAAAALIPYHYKYIYLKNSSKLLKLTRYIWNIEDTDVDMVVSRGIKELNAYMKDLRLLTSLKEIGVYDIAQLYEIAFSYQVSYGGCGRMTKKEVYNILKECYEDGGRK